MTKLRDRHQIILMLLILIIGVGGAYNLIPNLQGLLTFTGLTVTLMLFLYFTNQFYLTGEVTLKNKLVNICISFILLTLYYMAVRELVGFPLNYDSFVIIVVGQAIFTLWEHFNLSRMEKGILVLTLLVIIVVRAYPNDTPTNGAQLYYSKLRDVSNYEEFQDNLTKDAKESFTKADFREIEPYIQKRPLRMTAPAIIEFEGGDILLLKTGYEHDDKTLKDNTLKVTNIDLMPDNVSSYFRYYPLEIERKADKPQTLENDNESIIEFRGAFVSHGSRPQKRDWYEQLINVFGNKEIWDKLLSGLRAPEGPVTAYGTNRDGYLEITFNNEWEVDKKLLDNIYGLFRDKAKEHGIEDVPMVFKQKIKQ